MARGIIVFGANGSGKTALGHELARIMNFKHIDHETYAFHESEIPYTDPLSHDECVNLMLAEIKKCCGFVISAVTGDFGDEIMTMYDLAVFLTAPNELRMNRIEQREHKRYGERIREGGDMFEQHLRFADFAASRDLSKIEHWAATLSCPVLHIDGTTSIEENATFIMKQYSPKLPSDLAAFLRGYSCEKNRIGCSSSGVYRYQIADDSFYLKISLADHEIRRERDLLRWLSGKLPVPEIKYWAEQDGLAYLLMTEVPGKMACDCPGDTVVQPIENTVKLLADGLLMLQAVDISSFAFDNSLDQKLVYALYNIENGLVDMEDFADNGLFDTPMELYDWLRANRPPEDICFTHGDYCLPNIFIDGTKVTGFIDVGRGGLADKWQDIALCMRSLGYNLRDMEQIEKDRLIELLFSRLGIEPDWAKINYYILLDELF